MVQYINVPTCPGTNNSHASGLCDAPLQVVDGIVEVEWAPGYYIMGTPRDIRPQAQTMLACMSCDFAVAI